MIQSERLKILEASELEASEKDIPQIIDLESHPDNRDFLWIGTHAEHLQEIRDPNHLLLIFRRQKEEALIGYALVRLDFKSEWYEVRRIAIHEKGKGYGEESMRALISHAFKTLSLNKVWLDVYPHNTIGIKLYEKLGMHRDGVLRSQYKSEKYGFLDQIIYSLLRSEYD